MKKLFLVTPFGFDPKFKSKKEITLTLCENFGIQLITAENAIFNGELSTMMTLELLRECDFSIADLSYERPSCYYEVGYLQALRKKVYLISHFNTRYHQMLDIEKIVTYSNLEEYKTEIKSVLEKEIE